ncbi:Hypothetical predicted protein, partial [Podarcis lilfordi]
DMKFEDLMGSADFSTAPDTSSISGAAVATPSAAEDLEGLACNGPHSPEATLSSVESEGEVEQPPNPREQVSEITASHLSTQGLEEAGFSGVRGLFRSRNLGDSAKQLLQGLGNQTETQLLIVSL